MNKTGKKRPEHGNICYGSLLMGRPLEKARNLNVSFSDHAFTTGAQAAAAAPYEPGTGIKREAVIPFLEAKKANQ